MAWMRPHGNVGGGHHMYVEDGYDATDDSIKTKGRRRKKLLFQTVRNQMEFYFSDANLSKDRYLRQLVEDDPYVLIEEFLKFNKIASLVSTVEEIVKAVKKSDFLELSEDCLKVRRKTIVKIKENEDDCTIYVENLPPEMTHDELSQVFSEFGKVVYVSIPKYRNTHMPKGFAFVEFDTPKDAAETIRIFMEKGSSLSPHMLPEKLCSIRTFEQPNSDFGREEDPKLSNSGDENNPVLDGDEVKEQDLKHPIEENNSATRQSKKRKLDSNDEVGEVEHILKTEKKEKELNSEDNSRKEGSPTDREDNGGTEDTKESSENETNQESQSEEVSEEQKKKKKNRKKKKRPKEQESFAKGLVVLSKKEWKHLRSKYLNMQRVNMRRVKQQVLEARFLRRPPYMPHPGLDHWRDEEMRPPPPPVDAPKPRVTFTPGVIVCVSFKEPVVDVKAFKAEARTQPGVQYVDIHEGAMDAHLRCSGPQDAQHLLQLKFWKNMSILTGPEETNYWDKIAKDREEKLGKKIRVTKERGKRKLLKKAEIVKATHLHFDN